jgi:hypothetical protein
LYTRKTKFAVGPGHQEPQTVTNDYQLSLIIVAGFNATVIVTATENVLALSFS